MEKKILEIINDVCDELLKYDGNNMLKDGIVNSFNFISIISNLEDQFDIEINESIIDEEHFGNKDKIINTVKSLVKG